jgi:rod shape-determining protein MreD|tara:strand:+ start:1675 stop:2181 length:507 start_codon:yes stop_codon:yes gene_type:complete
MKLKNKEFKKRLLRQVPLILLFISVLNNFDFNYIELKYFSFNFSYILVFYFSLKRSYSLGYTYIFIAGLFNDVVNGSPIGMSSLMYLFLCGVAAYLRIITLRTSLFKDWIAFVGAILVLNSLSFLIVSLFFDFEISFINQIVNIFFTSLSYLLFSSFFNFFIGNSSVR